MTVSKELLDRAEKELFLFEEWFKAQGASPLSNFERAIVKTYIIAKMGNKLEPIIESGEIGPCQLT